MRLELAYNKIDNLCCIAVNKYNDLFEEAEQHPDDNLCEDAEELIAALDTFKKLVSLEKEIKCPLEVIINAQRYGFYGCSPFYDNEIKFFDTENNFIVIDFNLGRLQVVSNSNPYDPITFYTSDYKKTWWLKNGKSE